LVTKVRVFSTGSEVRADMATLYGRRIRFSYFPVDLFDGDLAGVAEEGGESSCPCSYSVEPRIVYKYCMFGVSIF
jgi:hypothetical protein